VLGSDSLSSRALLEIAAIVQAAPDLPPDVGDIFTRRIEYVRYIALLHLWENNWDRIKLLDLCDAILTDLTNINASLTTLLVKLDVDNGVADSDYRATIPVRSQSFLR